MHPLAIPLADNPADMFMGADAAAITIILTRQAAEDMTYRDFEEMRKNTTEKMTTSLVLNRDIYQRHYPPVAGGGQLFLLRSLLLLPLFLHMLAKSPILSRDAAGACMLRFDYKSALAHTVDAMDVSQTSALVHPNILAVYSWLVVDNHPLKHPGGLPATSGVALARERGALLDDGRSLSLWLGDVFAQNFTTEMLGLAVTDAVDPRYLTVDLMRRGPAATGIVALV